MLCCVAQFCCNNDRFVTEGLISALLRVVMLHGLTYVSDRHVVRSGECILRVWQHTTALQPCKCPICRRTITLLIPSEVATAPPEERTAEEIISDIAKYNRIFGGGVVSLIQVPITLSHWPLPYFSRVLGCESYYHLDIWTDVYQLMLSWGCK